MPLEGVRKEGSPTPVTWDKSLLIVVCKSCFIIGVLIIVVNLPILEKSLNFSRSLWNRSPLRFRFHPLCLQPLLLALRNMNGQRLLEILAPTDIAEEASWATCLRLFPFWRLRSILPFTLLLMSSEWPRFISLLTELTVEENLILIDIKSLCVVSFDQIFFDLILRKDSIEKSRFHRKLSPQLELRIFFVEEVRAFLEMVWK